MNESAKASIAFSGDSRIWYPLHPRWIPLLRLVSAFGLFCIIYSVVWQRPWSFSATSRFGAPAVLLLWCLFVQPNLRAPTVLNRIGGIAHLLLIFLVFPLALVALVLHCVRT